MQTLRYRVIICTWSVYKYCFQLRFVAVLNAHLTTVDHEIQIEFSRACRVYRNTDNTITDGLKTVTRKRWKKQVGRWNPVELYNKETHSYYTYGWQEDTVYAFDYVNRSLHSVDLWPRFKACLNHTGLCVCSLFSLLAFDTLLRLGNNAFSYLTYVQGEYRV